MEGLVFSHFTHLYAEWPKLNAAQRVRICATGGQRTGCNLFQVHGKSPEGSGPPTVCNRAVTTQPNYHKDHDAWSRVGWQNQ
jgi:hypothetical protein